MGMLGAYEGHAGHVGGACVLFIVFSEEGNLVKKKAKRLWGFFYFIELFKILFNIFENPKQYRVYITFLLYAVFFKNTEDACWNDVVVYHNLTTWCVKTKHLLYPLCYYINMHMCQTNHIMSGCVHIP